MHQNAFDIAAMRAALKSRAAVRDAQLKAERDRVLDTLRSWCAEHAAAWGLRSVRVFGSVLTHWFDPDRSDVDLLVEDLRLVESHGLAGTLQGVIGYEVHVVPVSAAPASLLEHVATHGHLVWAVQGAAS